MMALKSPRDQNDYAAKVVTLMLIYLIVILIGLFFFLMDNQCTIKDTYNHAPFGNENNRLNL